MNLAPNDREDGTSVDTNHNVGPGEKTKRPLSMAYFFPEIILAAMFVLGAPIYAAQAWAGGAPLQALGFLLVAVAGGIGFGWSMLNGARWQAYLIMLAVLLLDAGINHALPKGMNILGVTYH